MPESVFRPYAEAEHRFRHNGAEFIKIWRRAFLELCVADGVIDASWLRRRILVPLPPDIGKRSPVSMIEAPQPQKSSGGQVIEFR